MNRLLLFTFHLSLFAVLAGCGSGGTSAISDSFNVTNSASTTTTTTTTTDNSTNNSNNTSTTIHNYSGAKP